jgi:hypothetical protein
LRRKQEENKSHYLRESKYRFGAADLESFLITFMGSALHDI